MLYLRKLELCLLPLLLSSSWLLGFKTFNYTFYAITTAGFKLIDRIKNSDIILVGANIIFSSKLIIGIK